MIPMKLSENTLKNIMVLLVIAIVSIVVVVAFNYFLSHRQNQNQADVYHPNWSKVNPIDFLNILKKHPDKPFTIENYPPQGWIKGEHVNKLIELIDSQEPAASVVSIISSYYPFNQTSTVGNEAMFLIEGFKAGQYPPTLCSTYYFKGDPEEYRKWWDEQKN